MDVRNRYFSLAQSEPELFERKADDGIELLLSETDIEKVEGIVASRLRQNGLPESYSTVGIVFEDQYLIVVRDAVRFPDGSFGTYIRIIHRHQGYAGVAIVPETSNGCVLVRHFRHATRRWHWEIPRGFASSSDASKTVLEELKEEIGGHATSVKQIGAYYPDSGVMSSRVHVYQAIVELGDSTDHKEAISEVRIFDWVTIGLMIQDGLIDDGFTLAAFTLLNSRMRIAGT